MRKQLVLFIVLTLSCISMYAQSVTGGAGITHVNGDPDNIVLTQGVDIYESNICYDPTNQIVYFFNPAGTAGVNQWEGVAVGSFTNTDTRLTNPQVSGGNLVFDIYDVINGANTGAQVSIPVLSIAPVQDVVGGGDISVSDDGSGTFTVSFTEATTSLSISNDTLRFTDENGTINKITLPTSDGSDTDVQGAGDISVAGSGTSADPYIVSFTEATSALTINNDTLSFTDENGTVNKVTLPTSDGSDTDVQGTNDISVSGSGTTADPYIIDFTEATSVLTINSDTLSFTDENGTVNKITLPTSDGSDTDVQGTNDIAVTGSGTSADPYIVDFTEATTSLTISNDTLRFTDENGTVNKVTLPTSDGSDTDVQGTNDISVTGSGTTADPYIVDFTEATTSLTISNDTLRFTDENGTLNKVTLPTSDGSDTDVQGTNDISVSGTGTTADPYIIDFTEATSVLTISNDTLRFTDENGTVNKVTLPTSDGSDTQVQGSNDIGVTGTGTSGDPYVVDFTETTTSLSFSSDTLRYTDENGDLTKLAFSPAVSTTDGNTVDFSTSGTDGQTITAEITGAASAANGTFPISNGDGTITWSDANITSIAADSNGKLVATLSNGTTVTFDLDSAPRVNDMGELETAAGNLSSGETGIAVSNDGNSLGLPSQETSSIEIGVIFFIKKK